MLARQSDASGITSLSSGVVAMVVTMAITTIIVKSVRRDHARSSPTFKTISSISPRVFMSTPRPAPSAIHAGQSRGRQRSAELADRRHCHDRGTRQPRAQPEIRPISVRMPA
jgi:hypothetical protein